ncbi:MAG TPA: phosphoenolpyruvate carboxykinase (ATP), partial [Acidobacteriota bacterium]|nr:phosphoenolpyruvate carboxykinase (ATP) [Acidobacteriota bacterium]
MEFFTRLDQALQAHPNVHVSPARRLLIEHAVAHREAIVSRNGALATWTPVDSTGRSPKDTVIVRRPEIVADIDWDSPNNIPLEPETFDMILADALAFIRQKDQMYVLDRVVGADSAYALPVRTVSDCALSVLFCETMFRPVPPDIQRSIFAARPFTLVALPADRLDKARYAGRVRTLPDGTASDLIVAIDFVNRLGVIVGSSYMGSCKKLIFTVMNYLLPGAGILPLHASANEGADGATALFLGLSGTGKTTLSADPDRALLGDDEHGWNDHGIANFEFGCYAKLINLNPAKEPQIHNAIMHAAPYLEHGAIVENAMMYPSGDFDFHDA